MTLLHWVMEDLPGNVIFSFQWSKCPRKMIIYIPTFEDEDTTLSRNVNIQLPNDAASYPRKKKLSAMHNLESC
jgi:hypothetical protein